MRKEQDIYVLFVYEKKKQGSDNTISFEKKLQENLTEKENSIILYMQPQLRRGKNRHMQSGQVKRKGGGKLYCAK